MTNFKVLSHASALVSHGDSSIIMDPWLIGSCYWRSWWNYPPVPRDSVNDLKVDAIYITHVHWDHWHGPSLKRLFSKDTLIITHAEPCERSVKDLRAIGFKNIRLLKHGEAMTIGTITITPYQFGLFLNDSALVIETPDMTMINANDCKIAGTSLRQIIRKHGPFDFAMRSHSTANDRVCYSVKDDDFSLDDSDHYSRSFALFMNAVKPKFAIPFASNHCHLHKDVFSSNHLINDPYKLQAYLLEKELCQDYELKVMLSGDSWSSAKGFSINEENKRFFDNKTEEIALYRDSVSEKLESYYKLEGRIKPNDKVIEMFEDQIKSIPRLLRRKFDKFNYKLILHNDSGQYTFLVDPKKATVAECDKHLDVGSEVWIPSKVFVDAVVLNMFAHSGISKRNKYIFESQEKLLQYQSFQSLLAKVELGVFPMQWSYSFRLLGAYTRRWREVLVYFQAFALKMKGVPIYDIEEEILSRT